MTVVGPTTFPHALDMLRPGGRLVSILTVTADGDIERSRKEAEGEASARSPSLSTLSGSQESMREITNLIDAGLVQVAPINVLALGDAALAQAGPKGRRTFALMHVYSVPTVTTAI